MCTWALFAGGGNAPEVPLQLLSFVLRQTRSFTPFPPMSFTHTAAQIGANLGAALPGFLPGGGMQSTAPIVHPSNTPRETGMMTPPLRTRRNQTAGSPHPAHMLHGPFHSEGRCRPSTNTRPNHNPLKRGRRLNKQCGRRGHEQKVNCSGSTQVAVAHLPQCIRQLLPCNTGPRMVA